MRQTAYALLVDRSISVLLPFRNAEHTIESAMDSVLDQRDVDVVAVAIDDGSTDTGPSRVASIARRSSRVQLLSTGGVGIAAALNAGLAATRANWIARMDADDISHPDRFAIQLESLQAKPTLAAVGCRVKGFPNEAVGTGMRLYIDWQNSLTTADDHARELFIEAPLCHPSVMLRRTALEQVRGWREFDGPEDYDLWLRLDQAGYGLAKVSEQLFRWRHHPGRLTFADTRYAKDRFRRVKCPHLARRIQSWNKRLIIWGAGRTGRRLARELERYHLLPQRFIDIAPKRIGLRARGVVISEPSALHVATDGVVVAVGARGARERIRTYLTEAGFVENRNFLFSA